MDIYIIEVLTINIESSDKCHNCVLVNYTHVSM